VKQRYVISNLVYGQLYPQLFLENHLKSLLDPTNLPALTKDFDIEYVLFTDEVTLHNTIKNHPRFIQLGQLVEVHVVQLNWPPDSDQFASRYNLLAQMLQSVISGVLTDPKKRGAWVSTWTADMVFAKFSVGKMLRRMKSGHDAVFMVPIRGAADSVNPMLAQLPGAPTDNELFELAFRNLHHLWVASHWDAALFSKFPYSILWNSGTGLLAHNFGITPIVFKPNQKMLDVQAGIDSDLPAYCENPYWAEDWTDAACAGIEPLSNGHYPPFLVHRAEQDWVVGWAKKGTTPTQARWLSHPLYYPSKHRFNQPQLAAIAANIAGSIREKLEGKNGTAADTAVAETSNA